MLFIAFPPSQVHFSRIARRELADDLAQRDCIAESSPRPYHTEAFFIFLFFILVRVLGFKLGLFVVLLPGDELRSGSFAPLFLLQFAVWSLPPPGGFCLLANFLSLALLSPTSAVFLDGLLFLFSASMVRSRFSRAASIDSRF